LSLGARNIVGDWNRDLPQLEVHDEVSRQVLLPDGMVAELGGARVLEDLGD